MRVMLAGPIKHWWDVWDSPEHKLYVAWRDAVSVALVAKGHLVYRPHEAFKGEWYANGGEEFAQRVNDLAIELADVVLDLTPLNTPSEGTDAEREFARRRGVLWLNEPPPPCRWEDAEHILLDAEVVAHELEENVLSCGGRVN